MGMVSYGIAREKTTIYYDLNLTFLPCDYFLSHLFTLSSTPPTTIANVSWHHYNTDGDGCVHSWASYWKRFVCLFVTKTSVSKAWLYIRITWENFPFTWVYLHLASWICDLVALEFGVNSVTPWLLFLSFFSFPLTPKLGIGTVWLKKKNANLRVNKTVRWFFPGMFIFFLSECKHVIR